MVVRPKNMRVPPTCPVAQLPVLGWLRGPLPPLPYTQHVSPEQVTPPLSNRSGTSGGRVGQSERVAVLEHTTFPEERVFQQVRDEKRFHRKRSDGFCTCHFRQGASHHRFHCAWGECRSPGRGVGKLHNITDE